MDLTFFYTNANSIYTKLDELRIRVSNSQPTFILITETWMKDDTQDLIGIAGYAHFTHYRQNMKGGGVVIYVKEDICGCTVVASVNEDFKCDTIPSINMLWLDVHIHRQKFLVGCVYRPGSISPEENLEFIDTIKKVSNNRDNVIVFGDFNYPEINWKTLTLTTQERKAMDFLDAYSEINMRQLVTFPTRIRNDQKSLLDLILISDKKFFTAVVPKTPIGKSDHIVILTTAQINITPGETFKIHKRNFWKADYEEINNYLSHKDFSTVRVNSNHHSLYDTFLNNINETIKQFIPSKNKTKNPLKPWINKQLFKQIERKRHLWDKYRVTNEDTDYKNYRVQNNLLKHMLTDARKAYENSLLATADKNFYAYIKRGLSSTHTNFNLKDPSSHEVLTDAKEIAKAFATQFISVYNKEPNYNPPIPTNPRLTPDLSIIHFNAEKVCAAIKTLNAYSSPGSDEIPAIFLQKCISTLKVPLANIMNDSIDKGIVPDDWKNATVVPIYKSGNKHDPVNYRPISLTSNVCKIMEKIITHEITQFMIANKVIPESQHGFLPKRSVVTNLLTSVNQWTTWHDRGEPTDVIYLDYAKAFDKVPHKRLLLKLEHLGIRGKLLTWIENFLTSRRCCVRVKNQLSDSYPMTSGVPQGSVLGPLLFLIYTSDLASVVKSRITLYADDTKIFSRARDCHSVLQEDLDSIIRWSEDWLLPLNKDKCTVLYIGPNNPHNSYYMNGEPIQKATFHKDLGLLVTADLKWESHISKIGKKANSLIYLIKIAFKDLSKEMVLKLYKAYIRPKLEFAVSVWCPYFTKDIMRLEKIQRKVTRIPPELRNLSYPDRLSTLQITTLTERRVRGDLIEVYKWTSGYYDCENIFRTNKNRVVRGHIKKLEKEKCNKLQRKNFITNRIVYKWNQLQESTVTSKSTNQFKNRVDGEQKLTRNALVHYSA